MLIFFFFLIIEYCSKKGRGETWIFKILRKKREIGRVEEDYRSEGKEVKKSE